MCSRLFVSLSQVMDRIVPGLPMVLGHDVGDRALLAGGHVGDLLLNRNLPFLKFK